MSVVDENQDEIQFWAIVHPKLITISKSLFDTEHYAESVLAAFKHINNLVKNIILEKTDKELDGAKLMSFAFSLEKPIIKLSNLSTESERNIQNGYMNIFSGAMIGIRNPKAHENLTINKNRAFHLLTLASLLMFKMDESSY